MYGIHYQDYAPVQDIQFYLYKVYSIQIFEHSRFMLEKGIIASSEPCPDSDEWSPLDSPFGCLPLRSFLPFLRVLPS